MFLNISFDTQLSFGVDFRIRQSLILFGRTSYINQLKEWLPSYNDVILCYRAPEHTRNSRRFHAGCDGKGATVTIIRVQSYIFGGYTDVSWGGKSVHIPYLMFWLTISL